MSVSKKISTDDSWEVVGFSGYTALGRAGGTAGRVRDCKASGRGRRNLRDMLQVLLELEYMTRVQDYQLLQSRAKT